MAKNKLNLKLWFQELNDREKNDLKEKFQQEYKVSDVAFYRALRNDNLPVARAIFFAKYFNISVEDLFCHPLEVKSRIGDKSEKKILTTNLTNSFGLVNP